MGQLTPNDFAFHAVLFRPLATGTIPGHPNLFN